MVRPALQQAAGIGRDLSAVTHPWLCGDCGAVNQVHLIGLVATGPHPVGGSGAVGFLLVTERDHGTGIDRHRVLVEPSLQVDVTGFAVGETVYVRGRLGRFDDTRRVTVIAAEAWSILPPLAAPGPDGPPSRTHASPVQHQRRGHFRRVGIGTSRERLVRVRPATVTGRR